MSEDLIWLSASDLLKGYRKRKFSPVDVTKAILKRIEEADGKLNAFCLVDGEGALKQARKSEKRWSQGKPKGELDGVPVLVKDIVLTKGWPTLRGSRTIDTASPWDVDAPSTARLREHSAVFVGKTTTPEFGWKGVTDSPLCGITRNPWDTSRTPGGSSGGSSAALAAGMGPLAIGTDGGGSIRIPAGFTGVFGHKPSFGRVPAWPLSPFGTVAHVGPMSRTVRDSALMLNVMAEPDTRDWYALPYEGRDYTKGLKKGIEGLKIAYSPDLGYAEVDKEIAALVKTAVSVLEDLGAKVDQINPGFETPAPIFRTLWWCGARSALGKLPKTKKALLDPGLADIIEQSMSLSLEDYMDAVKAREALGTYMGEFMEDYDLLVTPSLPIPAFPAGQIAPEQDAVNKWVDWTPFSYPFNLTQQPAASVPCGFTEAMLPAGLQIVGRKYDDATVLRAAYAYENATDWMKPKPKL